MTFVKSKYHEHDWGINLYNPNGKYWFRICKGLIRGNVGKIVRSERCGVVDQWTTIKHRKLEIPDIKDESEEKIIQRRNERD